MHRTKPKMLPLCLLTTYFFLGSPALVYTHTQTEPLIKRAINKQLQKFKLPHLLNTTDFLGPVLPLLNLFPRFLNLGVKSILSNTIDNHFSMKSQHVSMKIPKKKISVLPTSSHNKTIIVLLAKQAK